MTVPKFWQTAIFAKFAIFVKYVTFVVPFYSLIGVNLSIGEIRKICHFRSWTHVNYFVKFREISSNLSYSPISPFSSNSLLSSFPSTPLICMISEDWRNFVKSTIFGKFAVFVKLVAFVVSFYSAYLHKIWTSVKFR